MPNRPRMILFAGMLLFLIGIVSGATAQLFHNPRLALSGHLEGLLNGMFLLAVGLLWPRLRLGDALRAATMWLLLFGTYANWALTLLGAAWGTKKLTPIAGAGYDAASWQENVIDAGLIVMILAMLAAISLLVYGLRGDADPAA